MALRGIQVSVPILISWMATDVWPADWSQFLPDLVGAIVTGLLIGLALAWLDRRRSRREVRTRYREGLSRTLRMLRPFFYRSLQPTSRNWNVFETCAPVLAILESKPTSEWARILRDEDITTLARFDGNLRVFLEVSSRLDQVGLSCVIATRPYRASSSHLNMLHSVVLRQMRCLALSVAMDWTDSAGYENGFNPEQIEAWARDAMAQPEMISELQVYEILLAALTSDYRIIRGRLNGAWMIE